LTYRYTFLNAKAQNLTPFEVIEPLNHFSPKDLFLAIPPSEKGANCSGTTLKAAFEIMKNRGVARLSTVPYSNLDDCSQTPLALWNYDAESYKIQNYFQIDKGKASIRAHLAKGFPVIVGCKMGDEFINASNSDVLASQTYDLIGQNTHHSLVVCGYDDTIGPNGAFRVINSWGTNWGDGGFLWIDQDYFSSDDFSSITMVALPKPVNPDNDNDALPDNLVAGADLVLWNLQEYETPDAGNPSDRSLLYTVANQGTETILATTDWNVSFVCYNAFDPVDYSIIIYDYYSDDYGSYGENDFLASGGLGLLNWWNYVDIPGGSNVGIEIFDDNYPDFHWNYVVPNLNGYYYFVLLTDAFNVIDEPNEINNFAFTTTKPIYFVDGIETVTIDKMKDKVCKVYPNPVSNILTFKNIKPNSTLSIFDIAGNLVYQQQLLTNSMSVDKFRDGLYFFQLKHSTEVKTGKFIKQ